MPSNILKMSAAFNRVNNKIEGGTLEFLGSVARMALAAASADILVDSQLPGGSAEGYNTIQAALDAATANQTILVMPGTYAENLVMNAYTAVGKNGVKVHAVVPGTVAVAPAAGVPLNITGATGTVTVEFHGITFTAIAGQIPIDNTPDSGTFRIIVSHCRINGDTGCAGDANDIISDSSWSETAGTSGVFTGLLYEGADWTPAAPGGAVVNLDA